MKKRLVLGLLLSVVSLGLTGCPPTQVEKGVWLFTTRLPVGATASLNIVAALTLLDGGQTEIPDPAPPEQQHLILGTITWMQNGSTFTMNQVDGAVTTIYTATVNSRASLEGTFTQTEGATVKMGTWSAEKL
jgi:hypothetical protein